MARKGAISFKILPEEIIVNASQGETILAALERARVDIDHSCGGMGTCGTCRVLVTKGLEKFQPRNELESEIAKDRQFSIDERLACQNHVIDKMEIKKPRD